MNTHDYLALDHILTGNLDLPIGKGFTMMEIRGQLRVVSLY